MATSLRLAITADLHWGHGRGVEATRSLVRWLEEHPPDVLILAGDVGTGSHFPKCLALFAGLSCHKAVVPGNHDLWVSSDSPVDSLGWYRDSLPRLCAEHGFHLLDTGPLYLKDAGLAVVGSINWYDYSWSLEAFRQHFPDEMHRLRSKTFSRGQHNDANFVRWPIDDVQFTALVVRQLEAQLTEALAQVERVMVVTHHPPFYGLNFPRPDSYALSMDGLLWDALCGNQSMEAVLQRHQERIAFAFCGHTHRARENQLGAIRGYNIGGDYGWKRLLLVDWPAGTVVAHEFNQSG